MRKPGDLWVATNRDLTLKDALDLRESLRPRNPGATPAQMALYDRPPVRTLPVSISTQTPILRFLPGDYQKRVASTTVAEVLRDARVTIG